MKIHTTSPRSTIRSAVNKAAGVLLPTYGPAGRGSLVDEGFRQSIIDDGFFVLDKFELEDEFENAVVKYIREAARKTNSRAGDGTTTAFIVLRSILDEAFGPDLALDVMPAYEVEKELRAGVKVLADKIRAAAKTISTVEELQAIAFNSFNNVEISKIIAEAVFSVGKDGVVSVESTDAMETVSKIATGMSIERGYINQNMAAGSENGIVELKDVAIVMTDAILSTQDELKPILESMDKKRDILFIVEDVIGEALATLILNKLRGSLISVAIKTPGFGDHKLEMLEDIAIVTGGKVVSNKTGRTLSSFTKEDIGYAQSVKISPDMTVIVDGAGAKADVDKRAEELRGLTKEMSKVDAERIQDRIARLVGGVAVVRVGAATEAEAKATKMKVEDAVNATHLAFKEGVVPGGGKFLESMETGSALLDKALKAPRIQLIKNGEKALSDDAVDPAGVVIAAIESAVSVAITLVNCGSIVADKIEKKD